MKKLMWFPFLFSILTFFVFSNEGLAQKLEIKGAFDGDASNTRVTATGTGQTTGHIANLSVVNNSEATLTALPQTVFIPSGGTYQPYVAEIPGTTFPPGETTIVPVNGFCVDIRTLPVPPGNPMPPVETWIPVGNPNVTFPEGSGNLVPTLPVLPFTLEGIPLILSSPHFKPAETNPTTGVIINWPGTDTPVNGTFNPSDDPQLFAPVIVKVYEEIKITSNEMQNEGLMTTPFSPDPPKELEAVIQQTIWIYTSSLTGEKYEKENFTDKIFNQFQQNTGTNVTALPQDQKDEMDKGIDAFWETFTAVGVEAKVLSHKQ